MQYQSIPEKETGDSQGRQQVLTFQVRSETFAVGILGVKEILEYGTLTIVPMMPQFVRGVINLRGAVVPVVDLAARFGGKPSQITKKTCIIIIEVVSNDSIQDIGVVVDSVNEVIELPDSEVETAPTFGNSIRHDFISGMGKVSGRFVIILDKDRVLSIDEMSMLHSTEGNIERLTETSLPQIQYEAMS